MIPAHAGGISDAGSPTLDVRTRPPRAESHPNLARPTPAAGAVVHLPLTSLDQLEAPVLLVAMPQVQDPFFQKSVVLLIAHEDEGSFGFVVNRPANLKVAEILDDLEMPWGGEPEQAAFVGGPVEPQLGTLLFATPAPSDNPISDESAVVAPGVSATQNLGALRTLAEQPPEGLRLLLGHAGWAAGQLMQEVERSDWLTAPVGSDLVFADDPHVAWESALRSVGVDPDTLPSWTNDETLTN